VRSKEPEWQPTLMLAATIRWLHLRSCFKHSHHSNTTSHTMRNIALISRSPAFSLQEEGRARPQIDRLDAIDRLPRNRSQNRRSKERTQLAQVTGFPQHVVKGAIGTRNRNERYQTQVDGLDAASRARSGTQVGPRRAHGRIRGVTPPWSPERLAADAGDCRFAKAKSSRKSPKVAHCGPLWPILARWQKGPSSPAKVMAHWPLWRRKDGSGNGGPVFLSTTR
jgi:hypothetical protein